MIYMDTRKYSKAQEGRVAGLLNGKVVANSGATSFNKGDVTTKNILIECKTIVKPCKSISIKKEWLEKNKKEAFSMGKTSSILAFDFGDGDDYFIINKNDMIILAEVLDNE